MNTKEIITWGDYLAGMQREDPFDHYDTLFDGKRQLAQMALVLTFKKANDETLDDRYKVFKDINGIVLGQFIACERAMTQELKDYQLLQTIANTVIRPITDEEFDNEDLDKEVAHQEALLEENAGLVLREVNRYAGLRKEFVHTTYNGVFYEPYEEESTDEPEEEGDEYTDVESNFTKDWYWYVIMRELAGEDIFKYDDVLMLKMSTVAPELAYKRQKQLIDNSRRKKEEAIRKGF